MVAGGSKDKMKEIIAINGSSPAFYLSVCSGIRRVCEER